MAHIGALLTGYVLDLIIGDPYALPHPIRWIGSLIAVLEKKLYPEGASDTKKRIKGSVLVLLVLATTICSTGLVLFLSYRIHILLGMVIESILTCYVLAAKCLVTESKKVYLALKKNDLHGARYAVSMIVGRDTDVLDEQGVIRACVETIAENTSDGVIAPLLYTAMGGPVLGMLYKAVNTMDSMLGYRNERYLYFGRTAARVDDVMNFLPSRISAGLMILAAFLGKEYNGRNAITIFRGDRRKHKSPNSAQTESVMAGALSVSLAGPASYFGEIQRKPYIGDPIREIENEDILRAGRLMYLTEALCLNLCLILLLICYMQYAR